MTSKARVLSIMTLALAATLGPSAEASGGCLVTPAELEAATGRVFEEGRSGKDITQQHDECVYAEKNQAKHKLVISVRTVNARQQFESRKRLLTMGKDSIDIEDVGDAAWFSGVAAAVLKGDRALFLSGVRRASDPNIPREKIAELLRAALKRVDAS